MTPEPDRPWQDYANCLGVDPDLFFPERGAETRTAKAVCAGCVVREDCLEYALTNRETFGIWGGLSERERRRIRRQRGIVGPPTNDAQRRRADRWCEGPGCGTRIDTEAHSNRRFCSPACKQRAYLERTGGG